MNVNPQQIARVAIYGAFVGGLVIEAVSATRILSPSKRSRNKGSFAPSYNRVRRYRRDAATFDQLLDDFNRQVENRKFNDIINHSFY